MDTRLRAPVPVPTLAATAEEIEFRHGTSPQPTAGRTTGRDYAREEIRRKYGLDSKPRRKPARKPAGKARSPR